MHMLTSSPSMLMVMVVRSLATNSKPSWRPPSTSATSSGEGPCRFPNASESILMPQNGGEYLASEMESGYTNTDTNTNTKYYVTGRQQRGHIGGLHSHAEARDLLLVIAFRCNGLFQCHWLFKAGAS